MATHWMVATETLKSRPSVWMATATIVVSSIVIIEPSITTAERRLRRGMKTVSLPYAVSLMPYTVTPLQIQCTADAAPMPRSLPARLDGTSRPAAAG